MPSYLSHSLSLKDLLQGWVGRRLYKHHIFLKEVFSNQRPGWVSYYALPVLCSLHICYSFIHYNDWLSVIAKNIDFGVRLPRFKFHLLHLLSCDFGQVTYSFCASVSSSVTRILPTSVSCGWGCKKGWSVLSNDENVLLLTFIAMKLSILDLSSEFKFLKKQICLFDRLITFGSITSPSKLEYKIFYQLYITVFAFSLITVTRTSARSSLNSWFYHLPVMWLWEIFLVSIISPVNASHTDLHTVSSVHGLLSCEWDLWPIHLCILSLTRYQRVFWRVQYCSSGVNCNFTLESFLFCMIWVF